jgi:dienelactone hydrolase
MKKLFFLILVGLQVFCSYASVTFSNYSKEEVTFKTTGGITLKGVLYLPKSNLKKIIINLNHPTLASKWDISQNDTLLYNFNLLQKLFEQQIGWLDLSSRFSELSIKTNPKMYLDMVNSCTPKTVADDADSAIAFLKSKKEFKNISIGLMGGSTAGISVAISSSRNKNVDFLISMSSIFTNGIQWHKYSILYSPADFQSNLYLMTGLMSMIKDSFTYDGTKYPKRDSIFFNCFFHSLDTINKQIIKYDNYDTITKIAGRIMNSLWKTDDFVMSNQNIYRKYIKPSAYIDTVLAKLYYKPIDIETIKWNPKLYYSQIKIPVYILFGDKDKILDVKANIAAASSLLKIGISKSNFYMQVLPDCDHSLVDDKIGKTRYQILHERNRYQRMSESAVNAISNWIKTL